MYSQKGGENKREEIEIRSRGFETIDKFRRREVKNMKKSIIALLSVFFLFSIVTYNFAQQKATQQVTRTEIFIGTVDSVTLADPTKGTKSEIVVVDKKNTKIAFLVTSTSTIYDAKGNAITLDKIQKGNEVNVKYKKTPENVNEAESIRVIK